MAKTTKKTKGAAKKARRNPKQSKAVAKANAVSKAKAATSTPSEGLVTETDLAILEAARVEVHSELAELRDALHAVLRWSNALQLSIKQRKTLPDSAKKGAWVSQWKREYQSWVKSIRDAEDAANRPRVAEMMDSDAALPALRWTALVRDSLNRLRASLHPMRQGADGLGFIRDGAETLPEPFKWPLVHIRRWVAELEMVAPTAIPAAKSVPQSASAAPERVVQTEAGSTDDAMPPAPEGDEEWKPAMFFPLKMRSRLRQATRKDRKSKRVRKRVVDGTNLYSLSDARRWWGVELE